MGTKQRGSVWITAVGLVIFLCAADATAGKFKFRKVGTITLLDPVVNAVITQNDPSTVSSGCAYDPTRGYGFVITFQWSKSKPLRAGQTYTLRTQHLGALPDTFDGLVTETYVDVECNTFVVDQNLSNWTWEVLVLDATGKVVTSSAPQAFSFAPCRLITGAACNAP